MKQGKGYKSTAAAFVPDSFVPAPNFAQLSDPDCSTSFWRDPQETPLDVDVCEDAEDKLEEVTTLREVPVMHLE
ncbi:uncharacterized protein BT62DRAFT_997619 [Guyanagaster necrorhizus]|uniref:Uncharacterized protein n=1 Tax=Guyanagaster necrorhizus TaxID=856835 RepID=A0A9P7VHJ0_9AGAR|nr:uncharacterized protein BT62DRAFT_997619 [Guyanagaster necrorhizus MCA 3950]KAG7440693.1 hypothetical protein BT62DRAFT_997619 [Guyanagaster necrorhizus MCA 3950]